jgi:hypothetical protein
MRRRHFNATQKLRTTDPMNLGEEKTHLEQEISFCGSGTTIPTRDID